MFRSVFRFRHLTWSRHAIAFGLILAIVAPVVAYADGGPKPLDATVTVVGLHFTVDGTSVSFGPLRYGDIDKNSLGSLPVTNSAVSIPAQFSIGLANLNPSGSPAYGADCDATPTTAEWTASGNPGPSIMVFRASGPSNPNRILASTPSIISGTVEPDTTWQLSFRISMPTSGAQSAGTVCTIRTVLTAIAAP